MFKGLNFRLSATNKGGGAFKSFQQGLKNVRTEQMRAVKTNAGFMKGMSANRRIVQQVGMQVSDLGVQIAGGQSAILSLTQNVPQVVQMFGAWGGILAAVITLVGTLTLVLIRSKTSFEDIAEFLGVTRAEFESFARVVNQAKNIFFDAINAMVNNLDVLAIAISVFVAKNLAGYIFTTKGAARATSLFTKSLKFLRGALIKTGIGAIYIAIGVLIERLLTIREVTGSWGATFKLVGDLIKQVISNLPTLLLGFAYKFTAMTYGMVSDFQSWASSVTGMMPDWVNDMIGFMVGLKDSIVEIFKSVAAAIQNSFIDAFNGMIGSATWSINTLIKLTNNIPGIDIPVIEPDFGKLERVVIEGGKIGERLNKAWEEAFDTDYVDGMADALGDAANMNDMVAKSASEMGDKLLSAASDAIPAWQEIKKILGEVNGTDFNIRDLFGGKDDDDELDGKIEKFKKMREFKLKPLKIKQREIKNLLTEAQKDFKRFGEELSRTMSDSFKDVVKGTKSVGDFFDDMIGKIQGRLMDLAFDPVFDMIAKQLNKIIGMGGGGSGDTVGDIFGSGQPDGSGSFFSGIGSFFAGFFAKGGTIGAGQWGVVGENGPEIAFGGSKGTSIMSNDMSNRALGRNGSSKVVSITNINHFNGVTREEVMQDVAEANGELKNQINAEFGANAAKYSNDFERGFAS